jgi:hypothetical protein
MNRDEFYAKLAPLTAEQRDKILWNLYWRGAAAVRERIEGELDPPERERKKKEAEAPPDPEFVLQGVKEFSELAESGAYIAGDRRVKPSERTKWRVTFRRLATQAQSALHDTDNGPAEDAMELMIDLACHAEGCFRSDDPLEAAKFVVSQAAYALWQTVLDKHGAAEFTVRTVPQFMRWERTYGWANGTGAAKVRQAERPLGEVLASMLTTPELWTGFADAYLAALDQLTVGDEPPAVKNTRAWRDWEYASRRREQDKESRARRFARWNSVLIEHLDDDRARRLAEHLAFSGAEADLLKARAACQRGDLDEARVLIAEGLKRYRWNDVFADIAEEIGVEPPG